MYCHVNPYVLNIANRDVQKTALLKSVNDKFKVEDIIELSRSFITLFLNKTEHLKFSLLFFSSD